MPYGPKNSKKPLSMFLYKKLYMSLNKFNILLYNKNLEINKYFLFIIK